MAEAEVRAFDSGAASSLASELRITFRSGKTKNYEWRRAQLAAILRLLEDHRADIIAALQADLSKPELETCIYEITMIKNSCNFALKDLHRWMAPEKVKTPMAGFPSLAKIVPEPLGVVFIISPWNYPILLSLDPLVGAIAAGNCVILKPSEISPATSSFLLKYMSEYIDSSAIRVIEGGIAETSILLEQKWDKIFYTGSAKAGHIIMEAAAKHLTPVVLELGGKCPIVVDSDINLEVAARRIVSGKWSLNNGQACVAPDYVVTTKDLAPKLVDSFKNEIERFYGKNPLKSSDLSRIVNSSHFDRLTKMLDDDKVSNRIVYGGQRDETHLKIAPTILLDVPKDSLIMSEEIFGPLLPIILVERIEDSFRLINDHPKPLAAYLFTNNNKLKEEFVSVVSAGGIIVNDVAVHLAVQTLPFGGIGESGMGAYHGKFSFDAFSHMKPIVYRSFFADAMARYPPYTPGKLRLLEALLTGNILQLISALFRLSKP